MALLLCDLLLVAVEDLDDAVDSGCVDDVDGAAEGVTVVCWPDGEV